MSRILIIDDSLFQRRVISAPLQKAGYEICEAVNGMDGLEKIHGNSPDLIVLDILMPGKTGLDVLKELKEEGNTIPVIMLTSDVQESTREECLSLGARAFVNKPVRAEEILKVIAPLIDQPS